MLPSSLIYIPNFVTIQYSMNIILFSILIIGKLYFTTLNNTSYTFCTLNYYHCYTLCSNVNKFAINFDKNSKFMM